MQSLVVAECLDFEQIFCQALSDVPRTRHKYRGPERFMTKGNVPTLYEWCGGVERIEALFKRFYEHVRTDSVLGPVFAEMPEEHFQTVAHFVSEDTSRQTGSTFGTTGHSPEDPGSILGPRHSEAERAMKMILVVALTAGLSTQSAQKTESFAKCPMHDAHGQMQERGEKGMGFSQTSTTHHFFIKADGGTIEVSVKVGADAANRDAIRLHLAHIAKSFQGGDFDIPMFVHDTVPPGVPGMKRLQKEIRYSFEESPNGGRVVIVSSNQDAVTAIHMFLKFQIEEHKTGDPTN